MKIRLTLLLNLILLYASVKAQYAEVGLHYYPHKFHLTNEAEKDKGSEVSEMPATLKSSNGIGFFYNKILGKQNGLQADITFMNQRQYYNYSTLATNKSNIYTKLNTINIGISHNLYLWDYENDDNVYFTYGISFRNLIGYTDYYNVETETKVNGVVQRETITSTIDNDKMVSAILVTRNDSVLFLAAGEKKATNRYSSINLGANFGLNFIHYFSESFAFTVGAKGIIYFMDPENKSSEFWSTTSKYKYFGTATSDKRVASKMSSFGVSMSLIYCIGR